MSDTQVPVEGETDINIVVTPDDDDDSGSGYDYGQENYDDAEANPGLDTFAPELLAVLEENVRSYSSSLSSPGHAYHGSGEYSGTPPLELFRDLIPTTTYGEHGGEDYPYVDTQLQMRESGEGNLDLSEIDDDDEEDETPPQSPTPYDAGSADQVDGDDDNNENDVLEKMDLLFNEEVMVIPEDAARDRQENIAQTCVRRRDSVLKYYPEPEELDGALPSEDAYVSSAFPRIDRCPSIESVFQLMKSVPVHFYLHPGGRMISRDCRLDATVYKLKQAISNFVHVPADHLDLRRKKNLVADTRTLAELGAEARSRMKFTVEINKRIPGNYQIKLPKDVDALTAKTTQRDVTVITDKGVQRTINVTTVHSTEPMPKLGGYQDSRNGTKYLHAGTSSDTIDSEQWEASDLHKGVQVFHDKIAGTQTKIDFGQQMERNDYYVSNRNDRIIYAKKYVTWAEKEVRRNAAIIVIQRYWRGWLARTERKQRMDGLIKRIQWAEKIRQGRIDQRYAIMEDEIRRQENPTRMLDIELLYRAINIWRKEQEEYVMKNRWGAERKAALAMLTEMEADLLLDLERTRKRIKNSGRDIHIESQYSKMGKAKRWLGNKTDTFITLDTRARLNVRQLHNMYKDLKAPVEDSEEGLKERFELLGRVNDMIKGVTSRLGVMLSDLITRELTYVRTNCPKTLMGGLQKRIANCFFLLCQDPLFNPEAKRIQKVPFDYVKLRKDMVQCKGCRRMQYRDEFTIQRGTTVTTRCHTCMGLYRTAILRVDLNLYRHMLDELRKDELAAGVSNSVTFLVDAFDLQFLVEQIWHGQSALSGIDNRYLLRLCRWTRGEPWTPWNCVLLTEEEAISHLQLTNMKDAYRDSFFHKVFVKQTTAKSYFEGLGKLAVGLDSRIKEGCERLAAKEKMHKIMREKFKRKARLLKFFSIS